MWTGELLAWDEESYCFIVDRAKDMIISGGENIYSVQVKKLSLNMMLCLK